jgi:hypothetical protein
MALVHPQSCECTKSELDLFGVPLTQISVEHGYWEQKGLTSTLTDQGPYEFVVSCAGEDYIDLANTHLFVEAQITKADGSALDVDSDVGTRQFMDAPLIQRHKRQSQRKARGPLSEDVSRCVPLFGLTTSGFFWRAFLFIVRSSGGPDWARALCNIRCPVVFNLVLAACFRFFPWTTSQAMVSPVLRASRPNVLAPLFNKGTAALNHPPNILHRTSR